MLIAVENLLIVLALFALGGGGIIVVDWFILRKIRRLGPPEDEAPTTEYRD